MEQETPSEPDIIDARALLAHHCPGLDPASLRRVRCGNAIWPGLAFFAGISFVAYLLVKLLSGTVAADTGFAVQLAIATGLTVLGGWQLMRARYFFVTIEVQGGTRRIGGLSKAEQTALHDLVGANATDSS